MDIVVVLKETPAAALNASGSPTQDADDAGLKALRALLDDLRIRLSPMHPGSDDPHLQTYFSVSNAPADAAGCEAVAERLRQQPAVAGAYVKPAAAPASG